MNVHKNPNETFWLAQYAHNTLEPLIKVARTHEPSIHYNLVLAFDNERSYSPEGSTVGIHVHWDRSGMLVHKNWLTSKPEVDAVAKSIRDFIDTEQAALEAREDAAAFKNMPPIKIVDSGLYDLLAADAATQQATTEAEADKNAAEARAELETFYGLEEARQAEEDADWDLKQDRIRERADIEDAA